METQYFSGYRNKKNHSLLLIYMKICSPQLGISPKSILGGEIYDRQILKYLAQDGHEIEIILPLFKLYQQVNGWKITNVPLPFIVPPHLYNFLVLPYLLTIYKKRKFDILRIHSPAFLGLAAILFKKIYPAVPVIGTYHWLGEGGKFEKIINPYLVNCFDAIICDSLYTKKEIENKYLNATGKVYAIHNGVDEILKPQKKANYLFKKFNVQKTTVILLYMGLFIGRKNPLFTLTVLKKLLTKHLNIVIIFCGEGPLKNKLENKIKQLNLENYTRIVSPVFGSQKNELLNFADIYIHPAKKEGFSLAVIEAMACGLPIVITDGYSAREAVKNGVNGFLCRSFDDWVKNILILFDNKQIRKSMADKNVKKVQKSFNWKRNTSKYSNILTNLVKKQVSHN